MAKIGDFESQMSKPMQRFTGMPDGPYTITRDRDTVTVVSAGGRRAVVAANAFNQVDEVATALAAGVDATVDGVVVGQLFQHRHGTWRKDRTIEFVPVDPSRFPPTPQFRLRRSAKVVCENSSGQLIGPAWFVPFGGRRVDVAQGVSDDLVLVYIAVESGLFAALKL